MPKFDMIELRLQYCPIFYSCNHGFVALIIQVWALQDGTSVVVGGKTNRAKGEFPQEINWLLDRVPELVNKNVSKQSSELVG